MLVPIAGLAQVDVLVVLVPIAMEKAMSAVRFRM